jgi:phosphopantetheine--protein transferase-like protein
MNHLIGCDIVHIPTFARSAQEGGQGFLDTIFMPTELNLSRSIESLAGYFAIKESVIKAFGEKVPWLDVVIYKLESGKPAVKLPLAYTFYQAEVSVAHHGEYAVAVALLSKHYV